jgi:hypothetical protein
LNMTTEATPTFASQCERQKLTFRGKSRVWQSKVYSLQATQLKTCIFIVINNTLYCWRWRCTMIEWSTSKTTVHIKIMVFQDVMPHSSVNRHQHFGCYLLPDTLLSSRLRQQVFPKY